jgi:uncharacterized protein (DUF983 family)
MTNEREAASDLHRLAYDKERDAPGAVDSEREGVATPCAHCGFRNYLVVLLSTGNCTECGADVTLYIGYGEEGGD